MLHGIFLLAIEMCIILASFVLHDIEYLEYLYKKIIIILFLNPIRQNISSSSLFISPQHLYKLILLRALSQGITVNK